MKIWKNKKNRFCISIDFSDIQPYWWFKVCYIATIWGIYFIRSLYVLKEQDLSALWARPNTYARTPDGFYWSSSLSLRFSSSLFYFRTDESSEQHLQLICPSFLIPDPALFMFLLLSWHTCALPHTHISVALNWRFVSSHSATQIAACERGVWSVLMWHTVGRTHKEIQVWASSYV